MDSHHSDRRRTVLTVAFGSALLTAAGLLWLTAAGNLAATGTRIARIERERESLAEMRAQALVAHALATNPDSLESRAVALGLAPPGHVEFLAVDLELVPIESLEVSPSSPLGVLLARDDEDSTAEPPAVSVAERALGGLEAGVDRPTSLLAHMSGAVR